MANDGNVNPMYVDTAAAVTTKQVKIQQITWVSDETGGDDIAAADFFELTDVNGNILISKTAAFAGDDLGVSYPMGLGANGITCSSIDGGICFITLV